MNKAQSKCIERWTGIWLSNPKDFIDEFNSIDPSPDPQKYKIIKNNDYVLDDDLTQEEAERYLDSLMKNCLKDFYDLEYYNKGDSLTISKKNEFIHYNLEQE